MTWYVVIVMVCGECSGTLNAVQTRLDRPKVREQCLREAGCASRDVATAERPALCSRPKRWSGYPEPTKLRRKMPVGPRASWCVRSSELGNAAWPDRHERRGL